MSAIMRAFVVFMCAGAIVNLVFGAVVNEAGDTVYATYLTSLAVVGMIGATCMERSDRR